MKKFKEYLTNLTNQFLVTVTIGKDRIVISFPLIMIILKEDGTWDFSVEI